MERSWWPVWGIVAGVAGVLSNLVWNDQNSLTAAQMASGPGVVEHLERSTYHLGVVAGWVAIVGVLVSAAGWARVGRERGDAHLAWSVIPFGLVAAASSLLLGYGVKGALAEYLPGGSNDDNYPAEGLYSMFVFHDNAPWVGWWGVLFAAGAASWLAFRRRGTVPLWLGVIGTLLLLHAVVVMAGTGAVAIAGLSGPVWLILASGWLLASPSPSPTSSPPVSAGSRSLGDRAPAVTRRPLVRRTATGSRAGPTSSRPPSGPPRAGAA